MLLALPAEFDVTTQIVEPVVSTLVIGVIAILLLFFAVWMMEKITPFSLRKEIEEDHNNAAAILCGAIIIGIALVISAAAS